MGPRGAPSGGRGQAAVQRKLAVDDGPKLIGATRRTLLLGLGGAGLAACPCCAPGRALADGGAFSYGTLSGPVRWGGTCRAGMWQSPIDVPRARLVAAIAAADSGGNGRGNGGGRGACRLARVDARGYGPSRASVLNTGVGTMQVNFGRGAQVLRIGGADLELVQYHFHTPSEHTFDGARAAMEAHLVHRNLATGGLAVVGVLLQNPGAPNAAVRDALKWAPSAPRAEADAPNPINPADLLPRPGPSAWQYIRYAGSLTTPGCAEGVEWYVMLTPTTVSPEQVVRFSSYVAGGASLGQNNRDVQPFNGRGFGMQYDCPS